MEKNKADSPKNEGLYFNYSLKYSGNAKPDEHLPLLVALHGDGDTTEGFYQAALDQFTVKARIILIEAPIAHEYGKVWPFSAAQFSKYGTRFSNVINKLAIQYPTINKPILYGFSGGGAMAYYQALKHGDSYAYIFPVSGLLFRKQLKNTSATVGAKVLAYHGRNDSVVLFSAGLEAIKLLKKSGVNVTFIEFEGEHHAIFSEMKSPITKAIEDKLNSLN